MKKTKQTMKVIIAVGGGQKIGKTSTLRMVFDQLNRFGNFRLIVPSTLPIPAPPFDIKAIGTFAGKTIGIETQGDPNSRQKKSLTDFANANCDIIICSCRTRSTTVRNIKDIASKFGYEVIWTSSLFGQTTGINSRKDDLNHAFSDMIMGLIPKL